MTIQQIVDPDRIEPELIKIWEALAHKNTMRASLFNLIVFNRLSRRTDYFRNIVQKVVEKFPCRTLFITSDPDAAQSHLKTAITVVFPKADESLACDQIDIGVAGEAHKRVPFLILPHITPDLPVYLLWTEDPSKSNPLFAPLAKWATRIIFDSECADDLHAYAKTILKLKKKLNLDIADLNWARTEGWRDLFASTFDTEERLASLHAAKTLKIVYNRRETEFFCHLKIQSMYLLGWLSSRLGWKCMKQSKNLHFEFRDKKSSIHASIESDLWQKLGAGTILSVDLKTADGIHFEGSRIPEQYHHVKILISSNTSCELPYHFVLGQTATGQSLVQEICRCGTSEHYLAALTQLENFL